MQPLLFDEGLTWQVPAALRCLELDAWYVGDDDGAPPKKSADEVNISWCAERGAVLITNDRGKKDKTILDRLATHHVHAIFVHDDLRSGDPHLLALAVLLAENQIEQLVGRRRGGLLRHRLKPSGRLEPR